MQSGRSHLLGFAEEHNFSQSGKLSLTARALHVLTNRETRQNVNVCSSPIVTSDHQMLDSTKCGKLLSQPGYSMARQRDRPNQLMSVSCQCLGFTVTLIESHLIIKVWVESRVASSQSQPGHSMAGPDWTKRQDLTRQIGSCQCLFRVHCHIDLLYLDCLIWSQNSEPDIHTHTRTRTYIGTLASKDSTMQKIGQRS